MRTDFLLECHKLKGWHMQESQAIEMTPKNIVMLVLAFFVLIIGVNYGLNSVSESKKQKRERLMAMPLAGVGGYIIDKNPGVIHIDAITRVNGITLQGNTLEYPYIVQDGFLRQMGSMISDTASKRERVYRDLLNEDCSKTAFSVFMQKGGIMHYTYHLEKENELVFLFDFNNTWDQCS